MWLVGFDSSRRWSTTITQASIDTKSSVILSANSRSILIDRHLCPGLWHFFSYPNHDLVVKKKNADGREMETPTLETKAITWYISCLQGHYYRRVFFPNFRYLFRAIFQSSIFS